MKSALANFQTLPLKEAACQLLAKLGYRSDRTLSGASSSPQAFLDLFATGHAFDPAKARTDREHLAVMPVASEQFQIIAEEMSR